MAYKISLPSRNICATHPALSVESSPITHPWWQKQTRFNWQDQHEENFFACRRDQWSFCCASASGNSSSFFLFYVFGRISFTSGRVYIYIFSFFYWTATGRLPEMFSNSEKKKKSNRYLPMGQPVERKWSKEWIRSDFQCLIRFKK